MCMYTSWSMCSVAPEIALHVLVRCNFAQDCWRQTSVPVVAPAAMTFTSWFEEGMDQWSDAKCVEAAMILWSVWKLRNDVVWSSISPSTDEVIHIAKVNYMDWCNAQHFEIEPHSAHQTVWPEQWSPSSFPFIKVNVNGAIFVHGRAIRGGVDGSF
uniref:Uncharacterized protein n=1 Tax=Cannabis sativa TaxID=3483 RepID=A0A803PWI0_CANSA